MKHTFIPVYQPLRDVERDRTKLLATCQAPVARRGDLNQNYASESELESAIMEKTWGNAMGLFGAVWGLTGVLLLLGSAVYRLAPLAVNAFSYDFSWYHWSTLFLIVLFMGYAEGYRGFQKGFSPRVAARARYLKSHPSVVPALLGPLFCMGFFSASRRRKITSVSVTSGIIVLILLVRLLPQPWRGIIDAGVVFGLAWGLISLIIFTFQAFGSKEFAHSPDIPKQSEKTTC